MDRVRDRVAGCGIREPTRRRCARAPTSTSSPTSSSTKKGFPSARSRTSCLMSSGTSTPRSSSSMRESPARAAARARRWRRSGDHLPRSSGDRRLEPLRRAGALERLGRRAPAARGGRPRPSGRLPRASPPAVRGRDSTKSTTRSTKRSRASSGWRSPATSSPRARPRISRPASCAGPPSGDRRRAALLAAPRPAASWPVRDPVAVRQAAPGTAERGGNLLGERLPELAHETGLPDTGRAGDGHEVRLARATARRSARRAARAPLRGRRTRDAAHRRPSGA